MIEPDEYDWAESRWEPAPAAKSLAVAIDGTYIRADRMRFLTEYHVVAGRIERDGQLGGHFAWVGQHPLCGAEGFMKAALEANGWTEKSQMRVLADGAEGLTNLVSGAIEERVHRVLDWFHISMRLRPIEQMSAGIANAASNSDDVLGDLLCKKLPRLRYQMWHGKWRAALNRLEKIYRATKRLLSSLSSSKLERVERFRKHIINLCDYLRENRSGLRKYALERRKGMRISSALAESVMSHLVNQRMGKRQSMRWSCEGAHLLLQIRCAVFDGAGQPLSRVGIPISENKTLSHYR